MNKDALFSSDSVIRDFPALSDIRAAQERIDAYINHTPLVTTDSLPGDIFYKLETWQKTGAFKLRGALSRMLKLSGEEKKRGVITVSTGNHGRAVSYAAQMLGIKATVCMSGLVPENKRAAIAGLGADIVIAGNSQDEAAIKAENLVAEKNMVFVPPFDDPDIIAGQGTIGLEIYEDLPETATVLVPLSGGGLLSGIACALKSLKPGIRVIGISTAQSPAMAKSIESGRPVEISEHESIADSLGGGIGLDNRYSFAMVRDLMDDVILLSEEEIKAGMRHLFFEDGIVAEGAAATPVAALIAGKIKTGAAPLACILSGRNIDRQHFLRIMRESGRHGNQEE